MIEFLTRFFYIVSLKSRSIRKEGGRERKKKEGIKIREEGRKERREEKRNLAFSTTTRVLRRQRRKAISLHYPPST